MGRRDRGTAGAWVQGFAKHGSAAPPENNPRQMVFQLSRHVESSAEESQFQLTTSPFGGQLVHQIHEPKLVNFGVLFNSLHKVTTSPSFSLRLGQVIERNDVGVSELNWVIADDSR